MQFKPGYKTSEFWFTLVSFVFSGLYLLGLIGENTQKEELITVVSHAVESIILISGQALIFYKYINGRNEVKKIAITPEFEPKPKPKPKPKPSTSRKRKSKKPTQKKTSNKPIK